MSSDQAMKWRDAFTWRAFRWPVRAAVCAGVFSAVVLLFVQNRYVSEGKLLPVADSKGAGLGSLAAAAAAFGVAVPGGDSGDANFVDILNSRTVKEKLLQARYSFEESTWLFGSPKHRELTLIEYLNQSNMDRAVAQMNKVLSVSRDLKSKVTTIRVETNSPQLSQSICKNAIRLLEQFVQEKGRTKGGAKAQFADARLREAREELAGVEGRLRAFMNGNRNFLASPDPSIRLQGMRLEMDYKIQQQLVTTLVVTREQALMDEKNDMPILNVLESGNLPQDKIGPKRLVIIAGWFLFALLGAWAIGQRNGIVAMFFPNLTTWNKEENQ